MAAAVAMEDAWMETCLISVSKVGGVEYLMQSITETVDFDIGDKDIEGVPILNGGRITKWSPQADSTITFEAYPIEAGTSTATTGPGTGFYDFMNEADTTAPIRILNSRKRNKYRVIVTWTNDPTQLTAGTACSAPAATYSALRIGMADGYFTSVKPSFTDGVLKFTCVFKCSPFDKAGNSCLLMESCAGGSGDSLPAIAAYTTANKFA
jgi:hypothetical protein